MTDVEDRERESILDMLAGRCRYARRRTRTRCDICDVAVSSRVSPSNERSIRDQEEIATLITDMLTFAGYKVLLDCCRERLSWLQRLRKSIEMLVLK
jgi:hypothetical protein